MENLRIHNFEKTIGEVALEQLGGIEDVETVGFTMLARIT